MKAGVKITYRSAFDNQQMSCRKDPKWHNVYLVSEPTLPYEIYLYAGVWERSFITFDSPTATIKASNDIEYII